MATGELEFKQVGTLIDHYKRAVTITKITSPYNFVALFYQCPLNVDWDGAARAYGVDRPDVGSQKFPLQKGLNPFEKGLNNAKGSAGDWAGVYSRTESEAKWILSNDPSFGPKKEDRLKLLDQFIDRRFPDVNFRFPVVQIQPNTPAPGYYVSQCNAKADETKNHWDQRRYADASEVAYQALSTGLQNLGVKLFDYGVVIRKRTGKSLGFYFGDSAGKGSVKVGECSGKVKTTLAPDRNGEDDVFSFIVFPLSGAGVPTWQAPQFIDSTVRFRLATLSMATNARELAVRLAMGPHFSKNVPEMSSTQAGDFRNIKTAFLSWGWDVDGSGVVWPDVDK